MRCPTCGSEMRALFTSAYCPNEDRHETLLPRNPYPAWAHFIGLLERLDGIQHEIAELLEAVRKMRVVPPLRLVTAPPPVEPGRADGK